MFPNPQGALPLPASPSIAQYRKLAKDLVKACHAGGREIAAWADRWMASVLTGSDQRHDQTHPQWRALGGGDGVGGELQAV